MARDYATDGLGGGTAGCTFCVARAAVLQPVPHRLPNVEGMKLFRRPSSKTGPQGQGGQGGRGSRRAGEQAAGNNATQRRPDPQAEPIPDGEHKYVPRSPYRTGNY